MLEQSKKIAFRIYLAMLAASVLFVGVSVFASFQAIQRQERYVVADLVQFESSDYTVIVFGSAIDYIQQVPRPIVQRRLDAALELYRSGIVGEIVVSGFRDDVRNDYNEPEIMKQYLLEQGVPMERITKDAAGDNSYATCRNASQNYSDDALILISQPTHIRRALYLCRNMGLDAMGYEAAASPSRRWFAMQTSRELLGNVKAVLDIKIRYNIIDGR